MDYVPDIAKEMKAEMDLIVDQVSPMLIGKNFAAIAMACLSMAVTAARFCGMERSMFERTTDRMWNGIESRKDATIQ